MSDVCYLEKEFRKEFKFQGNVKIGITFQRFDQTWEEHIDVDPGCQLNNREKFKAVVLVLPLVTSDVSQSATLSDATQSVVSYT